MAKTKCPYCDKALTGCSCGWAKAADGKLIHKQCRGKYNHQLKEKEKEKEGEQEEREE